METKHYVQTADSHDGVGTVLVYGARVRYSCTGAVHGALIAGIALVPG